MDNLIIHKPFLINYSFIYLLEIIFGSIVFYFHNKIK